jgi:hypothetical protein
MTAIVVGFLVAIGVLGTVVPALPGIGLIWVAALVYGIVEGFGVLGWFAMTVITLLAVVATVAAFRVPHRAAAGGGIGTKGQLLALALAAVGFFAIPVVGAPLGFVVGIYLIARRKDQERAWTITRSTVRALVIAAGIQFIAALAMAMTWLLWALT